MKAAGKLERDFESLVQVEEMEIRCPDQGWQFSDLPATATS
jgi:hypothetical protein